MPLIYSGMLPWWPRPLRRGRDGPDDRFPGLGRLNDLIDHAQGLGPLQAARLALVLRGEARLDLVQLVRWHAGDGAAVQDPDGGDGAHDGDLGVGQANTRVAPSAREFIAMYAPP